MTSRAPRRSLASAFLAEPVGARAAELVGLLPPRLAQPEVLGEEPPTAAADALRPAGGPEERTSAATWDTGHPAATSAQGQASAADVVRSVAVYLPVDLLDRLRLTARSREMTYADLLVEAATAHLADVAGSFTLSRPSGPGMPARAPRRKPDPGVQVQLRLDGHQVAWLDAEAARLGAASRTALVVALLRAHLGGRSAQPLARGGGDVDGESG